jgi:hypothetical protein
VVRACRGPCLRGSSNAQDGNAYPEQRAPLQSSNDHEDRREQEIRPDDDVAFTRVIGKPSRKRGSGHRGNSGNHEDESDTIQRDASLIREPLANVGQISDQAAAESKKGRGHTRQSIRLLKVKVK